MNWTAVALVIVAGLIAWMGYRGIKSNPNWFSKENFVKTFGVLGWLALMLIGVIFLCVYLLKG